ncbi:hypothetical protein FGO68_gene3506 [Halteria grandinella]|uniref:Methyltransferase n=1 Tax=Halteria grandinella TaxID=5974 RepID=A0A8J8NYD4_HALGN|nr:hypothetical protein FGO68_gene3506 [Halteria grandinella]
MAQVFQNSEIILTEMSEGSLRLMGETIKHNNMCSRVKTENLNWGEDAGKMYKFREMKLDFIIGSDIIYIEQAFQLLAETILQLSSQDTKTIIANADHGNLSKFEEFIRSGPYSQKLLLQEIGKEWQHELFQADDIKIYLIQPI